jgi:hypothetical protein
MSQKETKGSRKLGKPTEQLHQVIHALFEVLI